MIPYFGNSVRLGVSDQIFIKLQFPNLRWRCNYRIKVVAIQSRHILEAKGLFEGGCSKYEVSSFQILKGIEKSLMWNIILQRLWIVSYCLKEIDFARRISPISMCKICVLIWMVFIWGIWTSKVVLFEMVCILSIYNNCPSFCCLSSKIDSIECKFEIKLQLLLWMLLFFQQAEWIRC